MALFGKKKQAKSEKKSEQKKHVTAPSRMVLQGLRVTEKAVVGTPENVYAFSVTNDATKPEIAAAVQVQYNVTPVKVRIVKVPTKRIYRRSGWGVKGGGKKAYVQLKEGDTIAVA